MTTLHLLNHTPASSDGTARCLAVARDGDAVLLMEQAVLTDPSTLAAFQRTGVTLLALHADARAHGAETRLDGHCALIAQEDFVAQCTVHDRVVTWG